LLLFISGMGGFVYGYDIGIIGAALLYLNKTIALTVDAGVARGGGGAGGRHGVVPRGRGAGGLHRAQAADGGRGRGLPDQRGAHRGGAGFGPLFAGRTLQGLSAGMIAVVIPLYLAESLPATIRGRGTAAFQLFLTIGILVSMAVGRHYTAGVEALAVTRPRRR
jgi:SP family myo-inositol transporter-like MFS transporter 13